MSAVEGAGSGFDIERVFCDQYARIARVIARVVQDPSRAEDLAVEIFLKLWRNKRVQHGNPEGWLYRAAVRAGLDEIRRRTRRARYERLLTLGDRSPAPDEIHLSNEQQARVQLVLSRLAARHAELLLLRSEGLSYQELAGALDLNLVSVGTLLRRAQEAFRKEYVKRYGKEY